MKIALFLTFDYSLKTWDESGTLDRELRIYKEMTECKDVNYIFLHMEMIMILSMQIR